MASIKPTKLGANGKPARDTRWRVFYRDPQGRSRSLTFPRKSDAEDFAERDGADQQRGDWIDPAMRRVTFDAWADEWWATTIKLRPSTRRGYWQLLTGHVLPYFGGRAMATIDFMDVERFIAAELRAGLGPKKVRDAVSIVSLVMKCAVRSNARKDNPAAGHEIKLRRRKLRPGDVLDMDQALELVAAVRDPYKPAVWLLILTGIRPAELCGLRVRSVDFARHVMTVTETLTPVNKFDDQPHGLVVGPPKTEAGDRSIPIPQWLCDDLAAMLAERGNGRIIGRDEYLFTRRSGIPLNRNKFRETVIRPALVAAGLPESTRTYDLRHAHASLLIDLGANPLAVAQRMGHSDASVTLRVYGHLFEGVQERLSEQLDGLRETTAATRSGAKVVGIRGTATRDENATARDANATESRGTAVNAG